MRTPNQRTYESFESYDYSHVQVPLPLTVSAALFSLWGPDGRFQNHSKPVMSLNLVTMGEADFNQQSRRGHVAAGEVFLAHKGQSQVFETGRTGFLHKRTVLLEGWALDLFLRTTGLDSVDVVRPREPAHLISLFRSAYAVMGAKPEKFIYQLSTIAYRILLELARSITPGFPREVRRAMEFMEKNLADPITLGAVADSAGVSVRHLNRLFDQHVGDSAVQVLIKRRMAVAQSLLLNTSLSAKQVAGQVGYPDPFHFSQQFKKHVGASPSAFRKR